MKFIINLYFEKFTKKKVNIFTILLLFIYIFNVYNDNLSKHGKLVKKYSLLNLYFHN